MGKMATNLKGKDKSSDQQNGELEPESAALKRKREYKKTQPAYKRRRVRGGGSVGASDAQPRKDKSVAASSEDLFSNGTGSSL